ncbi:hypothetical protein [Psychrobacter celer]|uniref:hypothetical protein n=1 Tax=Psychrobacter celer TaxID=306572 RepID=UPI003FD3F47A
MNLSAKTIGFKNITKINLHPLAKKLYELMIEAYIAGGQAEYLKLISDRFDCYPSLPIHNVSLISKGANKYLLIGGCFSPVFNLRELNESNTIFLSYKTSKKDIKPEHKKNVEKEFDQDVIDFIFMDFIRSMSLTSLKRPGSIESALRKITQDYNSDIWNEVFDNSRSYLRQADYAELLDMDRNTIKNHSNHL